MTTSMTSSMAAELPRRPEGGTRGSAVAAVSAAIIAEAAGTAWIPVEGTVRRTRRHAARTPRPEAALPLRILLGLVGKELLAFLLAQRLIDHQLASVDAPLRQRCNRLLAALGVPEHRDGEAAALAVVIGREHQILEVREAGEKQFDLLHSGALIEIANEDLEHACACPGKVRRGSRGSAGNLERGRMDRSCFGSGRVRQPFPQSGRDHTRCASNGSPECLARACGTPRSRAECAEPGDMPTRAQARC